MESSEHLGLSNQDSPEVVPSLIKFIDSNEVVGFDSDEDKNLENQYQTGFHSLTPSATETETAAVHSQSGHSHQRTCSISISMPSSPLEVHEQNSKRVLFRDHDEQIFNNRIAHSYVPSTNGGTKQAKFLSAPIPAGSAFDEAVALGLFPNRPVLPPKNPRIERLKDTRFDSFKTWSGKFEKQLSHLRGKPRETGPDANSPRKVEVETLPVDRYFDALEGPELDTLRPSHYVEKLGHFCFHKVPAYKPGCKPHPVVHSCCSIVAIVFVIYMLKVIFYFEAVRREYYHPIRINFFFAPWIALLFLAIGVPPSVAQNLHAALWYILMTPIFCLELKIYGQWMSGGQRRLSKVANPSNHLSIVGNFVGALLGASMGLKEGPIFFFAVGLAHYTVLFVTLYQRLPTNETLPKELHPVFFLFVAAPSVASMAWAKIQGSFDYGSRIAFFIALFLYFSLAVRVNFFRGFRFSLAWWAYTFPMTGAAIATIKYSNEVPNIVTKSLSVILCVIATLTVTSLLGTTILHALVLRDLFPNDIAIAISDKRPKTTRKWFHRRTVSSDKDIENYLKFSVSDGNDIEASLAPPSSITTTSIQNSGTAGTHSNQSPSGPEP
ncbi:SLAC1 homologue 3 [Actinidia rufa]|uniref:SLAC1 homologue 3 n=1 Tax=Actinidia rufa TaxID=165716 RepID=A0A7J0ECL4_9ERIC|nr:SLAC1 homologue 3 [Actinidia rufa]